MTLQILHNPGLFFIVLDGGKNAFLRYSMEGDVMVIESTYTPERYRSQGLAAKITREALKYAKEQQLKVRPVCSYAARFFRDHQEYHDLEATP